jgi:hypothetical protein
VAEAGRSDGVDPVSASGFVDCAPREGYDPIGIALTGIVMPGRLAVRRRCLKAMGPHRGRSDIERQHPRHRSTIAVSPILGTRFGPRIVEVNLALTKEQSAR